MPPKKFTLEYFQQQGRKGGKIGTVARMKKMTPEQRSEIARAAVQTRWAKVKAAGKPAKKARTKKRVAQKGA